MFEPIRRLGSALTRCGIRRWSQNGLVSLDSVDRYLLERPSVDDGQRKIAQELFALICPKWDFSCLAESLAPTWLVLAVLAERESIVFHGTSEPSIETFVPRKSVDTNPFGAQLAVYATKDPLWAMFYSALDRSVRFSMHNGCFRTIDTTGRRSDPKYFFSISRTALDRRPFSPGFIYVLPAKSFVREPESVVLGTRIEVDHWASCDPVRPLARIQTSPREFPYLDRIRGHDDDVLWKRMEEDPDRFPWVDEQYR